MMHWQFDAHKVLASLDVKDSEHQHPTMEVCMHPGPISTFNSAATAQAQQQMAQLVQQLPSLTMPMTTLMLLTQQFVG